MGEQHLEFLAAGVVVLAIVAGAVEADRSYFAKNRLPFPCLVDSNHEIYDLYNVGILH